MTIETLELATRSIDELKEFYSGLVGLAASPSSNSKRLALQIGTSKLLFRHEEGFQGSYHFALDIPENAILDARKYLQNREIPILTDHSGRFIFEFDSWKAHAIYFKDPGGNIVELIARHELSTATLRPFSDRSFLRVSEIGLATTDVSALVGRLVVECGLAPYHEASANFTALGDAQGLLIVVPEGRTWFPDTGIAAQRQPLKLTLKTPAGVRFILKDAYDKAGRTNLTIEPK